jgi:endonuclease/exonuclease/phosphatase (EEP) superfamily protein YafD
MSLLRAVVAVTGALLATALVALSVIQVIAPQRDGLLALSEILAPYLFLLLVPFVVLAFTPGRPGRLLRWGMVAAALVFLVRFVPVWVPVPGSAPAAAASAARVGVVSWNLELGQPADATVVERLRASDAAVVGLVELTPHHASAIAADQELAARYQTVELHPRDGSLGIGLLSTLPPIGEPHVFQDPPILVQQLDAGAGRRLTVIVAHPLPGSIEATAGDTIPIGYDSTSRDRHLDQVRGIVDPILRAGEPLLLIGDFNVVDREPGYAELVDGLIDAQRAVGLGPGHTWRPGRLEWLPFGLLRIDYLLSANGVTPISVAPDCTPTGSDHCLLQGVMALP